MCNKFFSIFVLITGLCGCATQSKSSSEFDTVKCGTPYELFKDSDKNGDGVVEFSELKPDPRCVEYWKSFDVNGDKRIEEEDLLKRAK
ncbi:hypothetical protein [uncultured Bdellovibrio sp.]|uniref:hypothetical protein n=1 Tax=Bdellovibrio sp. HCB-162 TaxID=3394234 RepID=UPI0025E7A0FA|nr:hypothetical protein [uncultured Bdellovibrio sp.]